MPKVPLGSQNSGCKCERTKRTPRGRASLATHQPGMPMTWLGQNGPHHDRRPFWDMLHLSFKEEILGNDELNDLCSETYVNDDSSLSKQSKCSLNSSVSSALTKIFFLCTIQGKRKLRNEPFFTIHYMVSLSEASSTAVAMETHLWLQFFELPVWAFPQRHELPNSCTFSHCEVKGNKSFSTFWFQYITSCHHPCHRYELSLCSPARQDHFYTFRQKIAILIKGGIDRESASFLQT